MWFLLRWDIQMPDLFFLLKKKVSLAWSNSYSGKQMVRKWLKLWLIIKNSSCIVLLEKQAFKASHGFESPGRSFFLAMFLWSLDIFSISLLVLMWWHVTYHAEINNHPLDHPSNWRTKNANHTLRVSLMVEKGLLAIAFKCLWSV